MITVSLSDIMFVCVCVRLYYSLHLCDLYDLKILSCNDSWYVKIVYCLCVFRLAWSSASICAMSFWCWAFSRSLTNYTPMIMKPWTGNPYAGIFCHRANKYKTVSEFSSDALFCFQTSGLLWAVEEWRWASDVQTLQSCKSYITTLIIVTFQHYISF